MKRKSEEFEAMLHALLEGISEDLREAKRNLEDSQGPRCEKCGNTAQRKIHRRDGEVLAVFCTHCANLFEQFVEDQTEAHADAWLEQFID